MKNLELAQGCLGRLCSNNLFEESAGTTKILQHRSAEFMPNMSPSRAKAVLNQILDNAVGQPVVGCMLYPIQTSGCVQGGIIEDMTYDGRWGDEDDGDFSLAQEAGLGEIARLMGDGEATPNDYIDYYYAALLRTVENNQNTYAVVCLHSYTLDDEDMDMLMLAFFEAYEAFFSDAEYMRASESACQ